MRTFCLNRVEDETGVSGVGVVAEGVQFSTGKCVLAWTTKYRSVAIYDSMAEVEKIHGHNGKTEIVWGESETRLLPTIDELGGIIRDFRAANGMSQEGFARRAGLSRNAISLIEGGNERYRNISLKSINKILRATDLAKKAQKARRTNG